MSNIIIKRTDHVDTMHYSGPIGVVLLSAGLPKVDEYVLNFHEEWVNFIAQHIGINAVPAMIIDKDGGHTISQVYIGSGEIGKQLYEHLETKKWKKWS